MNSPSKRKVLLIGWDAADWKVIMPLVDAGKMPNLAKFLEEGICGNMATLQPVLSPMLWTSIATGKRAYKHGVHGFSEPDPLSGGIRPVTNLSRKTKAIWNILNQNGLRTITIGWWPSNPAEELSRGVMVSNDFQTAFGPDPADWPLKPGTIHPKRLEKALADLRFHPAELNEGDLRPFLRGLQGMSREELDKVEKDMRVQSLMRIVADCTSIHAAATALIQNEPWDFMAVYYDAIDHFGHAFMKYHPPKQEFVDDRDFRVFNYCLEGGYRYHDMMLGTLLQLAGKDTTVILMSDHGFHPDHLRPSVLPKEPTGPAAEHRQFGIFAARGPGLRKDERIYGANLLDLCPTVLHLFGLPVGEDMDGKVLLDLYDGTPAPIERLPSWDDVPGDHGMHPPDRQIALSDSQAALERLVALGYIAEPSADKARAVEETVRELDYHLAMACQDGGLYNQATEIFERLYEKWPLEHRFGFKLTGCYQSLGRTAEMRRLVATLIERRTAEAEAAVEELKALQLDDPAMRDAEKERVEKMSDEEKRKFREERTTLLSKARPNFFALRYLEATADFAEKKYQKALARLEQIEGDFGARRSALVLRGEIFQRLRRWAEAKTAFEEALEIDPESPGPLLGLARTALAAGDFETAALRARESIGLLFFQPRAHYIHGLAQYRLGHWEEAEQGFLLCVRQAPLFSAAYRMLGEIARWHQRDAAKQTYWQLQVRDSRRRLAELSQAKTAEARAALASADTHGEEIRATPELRPHPEALAGVPAEEIITVVTGLPRSGTSLMMQILEAAGIPPFTDGRRQADESNQKGYYEHDKAALLFTNSDKSWLREARGKAVKIVVPQIAALPAKLKAPDGEPKLVHYRILYMERDMDEIFNSQDTMLQRLGKAPPPNAKAINIRKAYRHQERIGKSWCAGLGAHAMTVRYGNLVHRPEEVLPQLAEFLGATEQLEAMRACIDPSLHRARAEAQESAQLQSA